MDGKQFFLELNHHDVLCGRGSGPNDRVGNIEFRNLVLARKAEYLAAHTRDAKGRIANSIIDAVRARGGRFLQKLNPEQTIGAGFKRGTAVYELADDATVLEKTKMTLRQNRKEFAKDHTDVVGLKVRGWSTIATNDISPSPMPSNDSGHDILSSSQNESLSSIGGSLNPLPFATSADFHMSARFVELLSKAVSSMSSNCSSVTNPFYINPNLVFENTDPANVTHRLHFDGAESTSSSNSANHSILSLTTAELCAVMGRGGGSSFNGVSFLDSPNASETSAQAVGALLSEYDSLESKANRGEDGRFEAHARMMQNQINLASKTIESMKSQFLQHQRALKPQAQEAPSHKSTPNPYLSNMQNIPEDEAQVHFHPLQPMQENQTSAANVFASLVRQYNADLLLQQQAMGRLQQVGQTQQRTPDVMSINAQATISNNEELTKLSFDDEQMLLQQFQQMQQQMHCLPRQHAPLHQDSSIEYPLNECQLKQNEPSTVNETFSDRDLGTFDPSRRRPSRRSTVKRDTLKTNTTLCSSDTSMKSSTASVEMNVEPVDYSLTDDSIHLSFLTANRLIEALDMSVTSSGAGGLSERKQHSFRGSEFDCSMISLNSLSLVETPQNAHRTDTQ